MIDKLMFVRSIQVICIHNGICKLAALYFSRTYFSTECFGLLGPQELDKAKWRKGRWGVVELWICGIHL